MKELSKQYLDGDIDADEYIGALIGFLEHSNDIPVTEIAWRLYADLTEEGNKLIFTATRRMT